MAYDLIVIGSGPGGYSAAVRAGQYGLKTAIIEKDPKLGGTCLHVGCIPTKALLHTADVWEYFKHSAEQGIQCENPRLDYPKVLDRKNKIVSKHAKGVEFLMKKNKVDWIKGFGTLQGRRQGRGAAAASGTQTLEAKNIIIATGSEARMLPGLKPDANTILTNIEILDLPDDPEDHGDHRRGRGGRRVRVHLQPLRHQGDGARNAAAAGAGGRRRSLEGTGARTSRRPASAARPAPRRRTSRRPTTACASAPRWRTASAKRWKRRRCWWRSAASRTPTTSASRTPASKLDRGFIKVDEYQQTGEPGVYAIGDVVAGTPQLAHVATMEGMVAVAHMAGKPVKPINRNRIPGATYTEPGIGSVGLTEAQARAQGFKVKVGKFPFAANSKASILGSHDGFVKVVADEKYGEILGVHIIGPQAFELISEAVTAMEAEATVETMMSTIHAHPTIYEAMGEAFNAVYGLAINV